MDTAENHQVVIAGGGPTGMMLAAELALAGVDTVIVELRATHKVEGSRAGGLHSRTLEVLDMRGVVERFLEAGQTLQITGFAGIPLDVSDFPTRHPYSLALGQGEIERILGEWVEELGVPTLRERKVTAFTQESGGVVVRLSDGAELRADYLVGCDGGRSLVRKSAGIGFPGWDPSVSSLIAEAEVDEQPQRSIRYTEEGTQAIGPIGGGPRVRVVLTEKFVGQADEPTLDDVRGALASIWGTDFGIHSPTWISRFTDMTRQAEAYRKGRVLLAGDAAHVHYPVGGQGLGLGVQDAVNLGWKLAQVVTRTSPESLLDTYHAERHAVAARVLQATMAQTALTRRDARMDALRGTMTELLAMDEPRRSYAGLQSGLDIRYDLGASDEGHPLVGRRMPDLALVTADGPCRMFELLREGRPVLLNLAGRGALDGAPRPDGVQLVDAAYHGAWHLPVVGEVQAPDAVLVRPDGYAAWTGEPNGSGLTEALARWFGLDVSAPRPGTGR
ncbi:FAD-dependent monooxygenase [Sinomonas notoginsengisoli]|uniref:FAD-dependent monooxygenase n=1 Tax=Sinomonas notoginsengisoli TaxID=1457311 RepID=UPI001F45629C|nr:FAD-dependent monooxygenase [Sinomonas notoginsengisoli]